MTKKDEPKDGSGKGAGGWQNLGCWSLLALMFIAVSFALSAGVLLVEVLR